MPSTARLMVRTRNLTPEEHVTLKMGLRDAIMFIAFVKIVSKPIIFVPAKAKDGLENAGIIGD